MPPFQAPWKQSTPKYNRVRNSSLAVTGKNKLGGPLKPNRHGYLAGAEKLHSQGLIFYMTWLRTHSMGKTLYSWNSQKHSAIVKDHARGDVTKWGYQEAGQKLKRKNWKWGVHRGFDKLLNIPGNLEGHKYIQGRTCMCETVHVPPEWPEKALITHLWLILRLCTRRK